MQNKFEYTWNNWQRRITADKRLRFAHPNCTLRVQLRIRPSRYTPSALDAQSENIFMSGNKVK